MIATKKARVITNNFHFLLFKKPSSKIRAMSCEMCGKTPDSLVLLPKRQPDGKYDTFACESCARESGMYCLKHERPHLGFEDETTACVMCIEEALQTNGERIAGMFAAAISQSEKKHEIRQAIEEWLEEIEEMLPSVSLADLPIAARFLETPYALNIARAIVTYAQRKKITLEEVIKKVAEEGPGVILPWYQ